MLRPTHRTAARAALVTAAAGLATLVGPASPAAAVTGGDVFNHLPTSYGVSIGKDIHHFNAGLAHNCTIWNYDGGDTVRWVRGADAVGNCTTANLTGIYASASVSGFWDTDVFTITNSGYYIRRNLGSWRYIDANVYTKISSAEDAVCFTDARGPSCDITPG